MAATLLFIDISVLSQTFVLKIRRSQSKSSPSSSFSLIFGQLSYDVL